jgi:hypothetical protein
LTADADFARPEPPGPPAEGYEWAAEPEDAARWAAAEPGSTCRPRTATDPPRACGRPGSVRKLVGATRPVWWNLCAELHAEGRWPGKDGVVMHWVQRPVKPE